MFAVLWHFCDFGYGFWFLLLAIFIGAVCYLLLFILESVVYKWLRKKAFLGIKLFNF